MPVLGLETSCDETAAAIYCGERGLLAHSLHSQIALHAQYGGVVPELASRDHVRRINPMIREVLDRAGLRPDQLTAVAYTAGPGLIGALMVGGAVASGIAAAHGLPLIPVHHMEGHLLAPMLEENRPQFPFVALLVSGGHTLLVAVQGVGRYEILGESLDDAVGEAFDKTAKLLGLPYPGGPHLAKLAQQGRPGKFRFPRPMTDRPGLDFSFSGLKTAVLMALKTNGGSERGIHAASPHLGILPGASEQDKADLALAFEEAATETLAIKCTRALEQTGYRALVVAGGVGANLRLRERLGQVAHKHRIGLYFPRHEFCTDNAAMIAYVGWARRTQGVRGGPLMARPRWPLTELTAV